MAFRLRVIAIEYDSFGETVLTGVLEAGQIGAGDPIRVPTANGNSFRSVVASMEGPGPEPPPFRAEMIGNATLIVGVAGTPPKKDVVVPCVAEGRQRLMPSRRCARSWRPGAWERRGCASGARCSTRAVSAAQRSRT